MAEFDGIATSSKPVVVVGATNRPQALDAAVRYDLMHGVDGAITPLLAFFGGLFKLVL